MVKDPQVDPQLVTVALRIERGLQDGQHAGLHRQVKIGRGHKEFIGHLIKLLSLVGQVASKKGAKRKVAAVHIIGRKIDVGAVVQTPKI